MKLPLVTTLCVCANLALAQDVLVLGEVHDNLHHHRTQAERVQAMQPQAIVFEMLTEEQAALYNRELQGDSEALELVFGWDNSGWPEFDMYYPIFAAAGDAQIYGAAVPRDQARQAMEQGIETVFPEAEKFGLIDRLPEEEQERREALQHAAHCDALPAEMLPVMVEIQRLRDASLARSVLHAFEQTGGPVAVITGNGHARKDWGASALLAEMAPELHLHVLGQTEDDARLDGGFDEVISAPAIEREDPCATFE
ncbi:hypothetical protein ROA7450_02074 [Roseovarius albus]|uniref:Haem-binding uptake Tiki superfamily ChaN domain-containing protein n=1 Tax=Roseovarius albus TaxID=1247867 RepID=A0A1X6Z764_9RHOB|nr:ChaN family lipoprotein [Roseovarius albus]SLN42550.1 hypothetical protein ROA7450_02074 [Roseovarius albus]